MVACEYDRPICGRVGGSKCGGKYIAFDATRSRPPKGRDRTRTGANSRIRMVTDRHLGSGYRWWRCTLVDLRLSVLVLTVVVCRDVTAIASNRHRPGEKCWLGYSGAAA